MADLQEKLIALHFSERKFRRVVFVYTDGRWTIHKTFLPWNIGDAFRTCFERLEEAVPGAVLKAAEVDKQNVETNSRRKRRYIASSRELVYPDRPDLRSQSVEVAGHWMPTNIASREVPGILRLVCDAADIKFEPNIEIRL
jgi:hypothetical protein